MLTNPYIIRIQPCLVAAATTWLNTYCPGAANPARMVLPAVRQPVLPGVGQFICSAFSVAFPFAKESELRACQKSLGEAKAWILECELNLSNYDFRFKFNFVSYSKRD